MHAEGCPHHDRFMNQEYLDKVHGYFGDCGKTLQEQLPLECKNMNHIVIPK